MKRTTLAVIAALFAASAARAQTADDIFGMWVNPANGGHIEMAKCEDTMCAKIVSIPNNDPPDGPKTDKHNPDETKHNQPIVGLAIMDKAYKAGEKAWKGSMYNPEDGKTYDVTLTTKSATEVDVKGCVMTVLCRTQTWTRLP